MKNYSYIERPYKRKTRITNKKRFMSFLIIIFLIVIFLGYTLSVAEGFSEPETINITVNYNDTLWSIAKDVNDEYFNSNRDIRDLVYLISKYNHIDANKIYPNQELIIPLN